jgi:hypothetical protein
MLFLRVSDDGQSFGTTLTINRTQPEHLIQAIAEVSPKVDKDFRAFEIATRYIVAKDASDETEMRNVRAEVGPPNKFRTLSLAIHDHERPPLYDPPREIDQ